MTSGGDILGYAASVSPLGFGGALDMMVGASDSDGDNRGNEDSLSFGDTRVLGSRVDDPDYLSQYTGKSGTLSLGNGIDAITGSTISSKAVLEAANRALSAYSRYLHRKRRSDRRRQLMKYTLKDTEDQAADGIINKNPVLVQMLGMCSTLAVTTSVTNALGMGLAVTVVLICSNLFISLLRKFIPSEIRIASYIVIVSGFVTAVQLLMQAYLPDLNRTLGLFIPLIVVNCIILARAESFASKQPVLPSAVDGLFMGVGYTIALTVLAAVRELLGAGTLLGFKVLPDAFEPAIIFILPSGAFLTLGFLIALMNKTLSVRDGKKQKKEGTNE